MNVGSILIAASASLSASGKASSLVLIISTSVIHMAGGDLLGTSSVVERSRVVWLSLDSLSVRFDGSSKISSLMSVVLLGD
jgi:hypothetical protein